MKAKAAEAGMANLKNKVQDYEKRQNRVVDEVKAVQLV